MRALVALLLAASCVSVVAAAEDAAPPVIVPATHHRKHLFYLPGGKHCLKDAEVACSQILQVCRPGHECEIQCSSDEVPKLSDECVRSHPCAPDLEKYCGDHKVTSLLQCLKQHAHKLSHRCLQMEPCLSHANVRCPDGKFWVHPVTPVFHRLFPFLPNPELHEGHCACSAELPCGDHLDHEFCQPCGPGCVRNPLCGVGRHWCMVASKQCHEPGLMPMYPHDCYGPYPHHPSCAADIVHAEAAAMREGHHPRNMAERVKDRCEIQLKLANDGKCPHVDLSAVEDKLKRYDGRPRKTCSAAPSISSFVHHFFDGLFGRGRHHHRASASQSAAVDRKLDEQEHMIRTEHETLQQMKHQLDQVKGAVDDHRFHSVSDEGRSWWSLLIMPLTLAAIAAVLYQWRSVRRS